ncbi:MAG: hypothetical protein KIT02_12990 [Devosia sp.]|uniref:hypothetical protein n=1 Tax=Devosia sp. TaxID=1871048 RepID=UPI0024C5D89C|nr:hypothetical protein [Devosia sp.]UYN98846.1 MAG: hypothetical protein KIT02_12990 [Devosia sp.]
MTDAPPAQGGLPVPLLPLCDEPRIERVMAMARAAGARRFTLGLADQPETVLAHFGGALKVNAETLALGSGGSVRDALPMLVSDPFFVMDSNTLWTDGGPVFSRMIERHAERGGTVLLCVHPHRAHGVARSHDFCLDPAGRISRDYGAPVLFAGLALMTRAAFADAPEGPFRLDALFDRAIEDESLSGVVIDADWFNLIDREAHEQAERALAG